MEFIALDVNSDVAKHIIHLRLFVNNRRRSLFTPLIVKVVQVDPLGSRETRRESRLA